MQEAIDEYRKALQQLAAGGYDDDELFEQLRKSTSCAQRCVGHAEREAAEAGTAEAKEEAEKVASEFTALLRPSSESSAEQICMFFMSYTTKRKKKTRIIAEVLVILFSDATLKACALKDVERKREVFAQLIAGGVLSKDDALKINILNLFQEDVEFQSCLAEADAHGDERKSCEHGGKLSDESGGYQRGGETLPAAPVARERRQAELKWMWADAKIFSSRLAQMNPLRWSKAHMPFQLGQDIKDWIEDHPDCVDKPVRIKAASDDNLSREFPTPQEAIEWLINDGVLES